MSDSAWQHEIDWADTYKRLCALANALLARGPVEAISPEDLAQEVIRRFLAVPERFLKPHTRDLTRVLCQALKFEHKDRLRRQQVRRHLMETLSAPAGPDAATERTSACDAAIECRQIREQLREPALEELFDAMAETNGDPNENQKLATLLQSTPGEVVNRKKRLRRRAEMISSGRKPASGEGVTS